LLITGERLDRFGSNFFKNILNSMKKAFMEINIEKVAWKIEKFGKNLKLWKLKTIFCL